MTGLLLALVAWTTSQNTVGLDRSSAGLRNSARIIYTIQKSNIKNECSNLYLVGYDKKKSYAMFVSSCVNGTGISNTSIGIDYKNLLLTKVFK